MLGFIVYFLCSEFNQLLLSKGLLLYIRMLTIHYPEPSFQIKKVDGKDFIFDRVRKKWLLLTEEEWVRQNFVQYLVQVKKYGRERVCDARLEKLNEVNEWVAQYKEFWSKKLNALENYLNTISENKNEKYEKSTGKNIKRK